MGIWISNKKGLLDIQHIPVLAHKAVNLLEEPGLVCVGVRMRK